MISLYPLVFSPIYKKKIWGNQAIASYDVNLPEGKIGESWLISPIDESFTYVSKGSLKGYSIESVIDKFGVEFLGERCVKKFGHKLPVLVKILDASKWLSIQAHPNDCKAKEKNLPHGKKEFWYVLDCSANSEILLGFQEGLSREECVKNLDKGNVGNQVFNHIKIDKGDTFWVDAGVVHAIGQGAVILEIQKPLEVTYRIYDWDREGGDGDGESRPLHQQDVLDMVSFPTSFYNGALSYKQDKNIQNKVLDNQDFIINYLNINGIYSFPCSEIDSFKIYICLYGEGVFRYNNTEELLTKGRAILVPAICEGYEIIASKAYFLEVFV